MLMDGGFSKPLWKDSTVLMLGIWTLELRAGRGYDRVEEMNWAGQVAVMAPER